MEKPRICEWIATTRARKGQTQADAARAIGCHPGVYGRWERGRKPDASYLVALARWAGEDLGTVAGMALNAGG